MECCAKCEAYQGGDNSGCGFFMHDYSTGQCQLGHVQYIGMLIEGGRRVHFKAELQCEYGFPWREHWYVVFGWLHYLGKQLSTYSLASKTEKKKYPASGTKLKLLHFWTFSNIWVISWFLKHPVSGTLHFFFHMEKSGIRKYAPLTFLFCPFCWFLTWGKNMQNIVKYTY